MQRNGFTLIELIISVGLLALLGTLIASNMVGVQSRQLEANYNNYKEQLTAAACLYIESKEFGGDGAFLCTSPSTKYTKKSDCLTRDCCVLTSTLIDNGFLDKDLENPATGLSVTRNEKVMIHFVSGVKTCEYKG